MRVIPITHLANARELMAEFGRGPESTIMIGIPRMIFKQAINAGVGSLGVTYGAAP